MNYIKPILSTLLVLIASVIGYSYIKFDSRYAVKKALGAYKNKDYNTSEYYLSVLNKKKHIEYFLYKAYVERGKKNLDLSSNLLNELSTLQENSPLIEERDFNQYLNAYLNHDFVLLDQKLGQKEGKCSAYFLFKGLSCYQKENYQGAKEYFLKLTPGFFASKWMEADWLSYFSESTLTYYLTHSLIESAEPYRARQTIETFLTKTNNKEPQFSYLLGLSYYTEAETKTLDLAIPYYQIAFTHFKRIPFWEGEFEPHKKKIRGYYKKLLEAVLEACFYEELGYFLDALNYLDTSVSDVSELFLKHIQKEASSNNKSKLMSLATQTLAFCHNTSFKEKLAESLYFYIQNLIVNHDVDSVVHLWPLYYQISAHPEEDKEAFSRLILERIESIVELDDSKLTNSALWLRFLTSLEFASEHKRILLENLTPTLKNMWKSKAPKAWLFSKYLDKLIFEEQKEIFYQKMTEVLENLKGELQMQDSPHEDLFKEANQYFTPIE